MQYPIAMATHTGKVRRNNEDALWATGVVTEEDWFSRSGFIPADCGGALIADGMGGHVGGALASQLAVELLHPALPKLDSLDDVRCALNAVNDGLFMAMDIEADCDGMGTTIVGATFRGNGVIIFNVGDSRAYLHSQGHLSQISKDHVIEGHILTQCLGGYDQTPIEPFFIRQCLPAPCRILLCSDGLTDMVVDDQIEAILARGQADVADELVMAALDTGGVDNVSVIVIDIE